MRLRDALLECTLPLLRKIAEHHSVPAGDDTLRPELAARLSATLLEPGYLERYAVGLPEGERRILAEVGRSGWVAKAFVVDRLCPRKAGPTSPGRREPPSPCLSLLQQGLLYRGFGPVGDWRGELYYLPEEMQPALLPIVAASTSEAGIDVKSSAVPAAEVEHAAEFDLFCLLSYLCRQPCRLHGEKLSRVDAERMDAECGHRTEVWCAGKPEDRWTFLLQLCLSRGWVHRQGRSLVVGPGAVRALARGATPLRDRLLQSYLGNRGWSDMDAAGRVHQLLGGRRVDEVSARRVIIHYLETACRNDWSDEAAFCEALHLANPDFLREDYSSPGWAVVDTLSGIELYGDTSWDAVEGEWLRYLLRGPLFWLGFLRWGMSAGGLPVAFRLAGPKQTAAADPITLAAAGDELSVTASVRCDAARLLQLERYMELRKRAGSSTYRLGRDTVLAAMETGGSRDELVELLQALGGAAIDRGLVDRAARWAGEYGRFTIESATLLTAESEEDSAWAEGLPGVASSLGNRVGGTSQRLVPEHLWEVVEALKKAGQLPRVDPSLRRQLLHRLAADTELLREALFALLLLRATLPGVQWGDAATAVRKLEAALGPEEASKVRSRAEEAAKRVDRPRGAMENGR